MEADLTPENSTTLPLRLRLKRAALVALFLGLWAPIKIGWELRIAHEQDVLRYRTATVSISLRDKLSQGLAIGVLSGMRNVVADMVWLTMVVAWMNQDWWKMSTIINLCTSLQPRAPMFWDTGGWHLAWNASTATQYDVREPNELRRLKASRFWIERGEDILLRGVENNPDNWHLSQTTAMLYDQRLHDYRTAAGYYQRAADLPGAPVFLERFPAHMYDAHHADDPAAEYAEWVKLWNRLSPEQRAMPIHTAGEIERNIRRLEAKLNVPKEKRVFPN